MLVDINCLVDITDKWWLMISALNFDFSVSTYGEIIDNECWWFVGGVITPMGCSTQYIEDFHPWSAQAHEVLGFEQFLDWKASPGLLPLNLTIRCILYHGIGDEPGSLGRHHAVFFLRTKLKLSDPLREPFTSAGRARLFDLQMPSRFPSWQRCLLAKTRQCTFTQGVQGVFYLVQAE